MLGIGIAAAALAGPIMYEALHAPWRFDETSFLGAFLRSTGEILNAPERWRGTFAFGLFWGLLFYAVAAGRFWERLVITHRHISQVTKTQHLIETAMVGQARAFALYLRPFAIDALTADVERKVAELGYATIALGNPFVEDFADKHIARVWADDSDWQDVVEPLHSSAQAIVVHPSVQEGTRWEMEVLLSSPHLYSRAYIVVPPARNHELARHYRSAQQMFDREHRWPEPGEQVTLVPLSLKSVDP